VIANEKIFLKDGEVVKTANNINLQLVYNGVEYVVNSPSFLNVFEIVDENTLNFVKSFFLDVGGVTLNFVGKNKQRYLFYGRIFYRGDDSDIKIRAIHEIVDFDERNVKNSAIVIVF
jgi:hypothetical protein